MLGDSDHPGVDLHVKDWQIVGIPIDALALTGAIEPIRLVGDLDGTFYIDDVRLVAENPPSATAILETRSKGTPETFTLSQNYPNPFNPGTTIRFDLHRSQEIELAIYNLAAQKVANWCRVIVRRDHTPFDGMVGQTPASN
jgi:hypothetical protein